MSFSGYCRIFFRRVNRVPPMSFSTFSGDIINLSYTSYDCQQTNSSDKPVMVLHGLLDSAKCWTKVCEDIHKNTGRKVINVDARNHGKSPYSPANTYIHMAYDTRKLVNRLRLPKVSILGHSMGGRTGMVLALLYPELVSSLVVVDMSPVSISRTLTSTFPQILDFAAHIDLSQLKSVDRARDYVEQKLLSFAMKQTKTSNIKRNALQIIQRNVGIKPDGTVGWLCNMDVLNKSFQTLTRFPYNTNGKMYTGPVLFIAGGLSDFIPIEDIDGIKTLFPQAHVKYVPGVGHNIHEEDSNTLIELATKFLLKSNKNITESSWA